VIRRAVALAGVWLSPAALLGLGPALLADGVGGLWPFVALGAGAVVAAVALAGPGRGPGRPGSAPSALVAARWPQAGLELAPVRTVDVATALLFLWAQLAAVREVATVLAPGLPPATGAAGTVLLAVLAARPGLADRAAAGLAGLGLAALALPLAAVLAVTTAWWPTAWRAVADRPVTAFSETSPWVREGRPVLGAEAMLALPVRDEPRLTAPVRAHVRLEPWEGGAVMREVGPGTELALRAGDRLVVPHGTVLRFPPGSRIPGAPESGPAWAAPPGPPPSPAALAAPGVALAAGGLGLAAVHATLGPPGAAALGASGAVLGLGAGALWALHTAWLAPEVYLGGVAGAELALVPETLARLDPAGPALARLALAGLVAAALGAGLAALRGAGPGLAALTGRGPAGPVGLLSAAGALAWLAPAGAWPVLLAAFGLAAAAGAPAALLAVWSERATARGVGAGAAAALAAFALLEGAVLAGAWAGVPALAAGAAPWPVLVALPLNLLVARLAVSRRPASARSPLPPGLKHLHE
jgi:hypothetical protein